MATIRVDEEYAAEAWWDAARTLAAKRAYPDFTRVMNAIERGGEEFSAGGVEAFVERASTLPGWNEGPSYACHPVLFDLEDNAPFDARTAVAGDYVYEWTEEDRESLSSHVGPSDSEMAGIRAALRTRDLTTATDDRGIRVVPRED